MSRGRTSPLGWTRDCSRDQAPSRAQTASRLRATSWLRDRRTGRPRRSTIALRLGAIALRLGGHGSAHEERTLSPGRHLEHVLAVRLTAQARAASRPAPCPSWCLRWQSRCHASRLAIFQAPITDQPTIHPTMTRIIAHVGIGAMPPTTPPAVPKSFAALLASTNPYSTQWRPDQVTPTEWPDERPRDSLRMSFLRALKQIPRVTTGNRCQNSAERHQDRS